MKTLLKKKLTIALAAGIYFLRINALDYLKEIRFLLPNIFSYQSF